MFRFVYLNISYNDLICWICIFRSTRYRNPIPTPTPTIQQEIDDLIKAYEATLQNELLNGETIEVQDPLDGKTLMLIGESAKKMEALWQEVVNRINELSARPAEERVSAVQLIQSIDGVGDVIYLDRDRVLTIIELN